MTRAPADDIAPGRHRKARANGPIPVPVLLVLLALAAVVFALAGIAVSGGDLSLLPEVAPPELPVQTNPPAMVCRTQ